MARRSGYIMRGGRQRRESLWLGIDATRFTLATANSAAITHNLNAAGLALRPFTIVRTIGYWQLRSDQTGAAENYDGALGFSVVSDQAIAIGVTAVPTPYTDIGSDLFFLHQIMASRFEFVSGVGFESAAGLMGTFESRAMRKVNEDSDVCFAAEVSGVSLGASFFMAGRMLVKLH